MELYRRIVFIGFLPLLGSGTLRAIIGCFLSLVLGKMVREISPFVNESTNILNDFAQYQILFTLLAALAIETGTLGILGLSDLALGSILLVINLGLLLLLAVLSYKSFLKDASKMPLPSGCDW